MRFEAVLGIWVFSFVCLAIIIIGFGLKMQYEREQRRKKAAGRSAPGR